MRGIAWGTVIFILLFFLSSPASASAGDDVRLDYLTQALQSQESNAEYWEYGWGGFDSGTMLWSAIQAGREQNRKARNTDIVQAAESFIGLADVVFRPLPAFNADSVCDTQKNRMQCLAAREQLLERSAARAQDPYEALPHLENAGFNLLVGLFVWRLGGTGRALTTAIPGEIIGELQLWTMPGQPIADFNQYKIRFSPLLIQADPSGRMASGMLISFKF